MKLPFFYCQSSANPQDLLVLDEENSRHIVNVLRMAPGETLHLSDGLGQLHTAELVEDHKKKASVRILQTQTVPPTARQVTIAISLLKNNSRFEWFLEKATEIGVTRIIPLLCDRTERSHVRAERLHSVMVSALLQSQQAWLPVLEAPQTFSQALTLMTTATGEAKRFIAHCIAEEKNSLAACVSREAASQILIGPEGDFTPAEIDRALKAGFIPVSLGDNRLRTETAGMVAATLLKLGN